MASNGDNITGTVENGGVDVSAGRNLKKTVDLNTVDLDRTEETLVVAAAESADGSVAESEKKKGVYAAKVSVSMTVGDNAPVNDIEKKIRRAERFGLSVKLSEEEKRSSRAERFGSATAKNESEASKKSEELKRKARAERFGLPVSSEPADEEAKKKARLARFGSDTKTDSVEEEKRKARALRFSSSSSNASSQKSSAKNIGNEAAIVGKAV